ncbi:YkvA family protein [Actinosynnema sp. NPDC050801]|uniref:YkvA family protein n=1 Tax=unclassified Actinosynnema TaxID=2637065 RepID=UPI0033C899C2
MDVLPGVVLGLLGLLGLWLLLILALLVIRPRGAALSLAVRLLPDVLRLVARLSRDDRVPRSARVRLWLLLAYLALPFDLVPDFIPVLGYADDAIVAGWVLRSVIRASGPEVVAELWPGTPEGLVVLRRLTRT